VLRVHPQMLGVFGDNVFPRLTLHLVLECLQVVDCYMRLTAVQRMLRGIELGYQTLGHSLVVDMSHLGGMDDTGLQSAYRRLLVLTILRSHYQLGEHEADDGNDESDIERVPDCHDLFSLKMIEIRTNPNIRSGGYRFAVLRDGQITGVSGVNAYSGKVRFKAALLQ
jgi:hypothetical protein